MLFPLLLLTYGVLVAPPYPGLYIDPASGQVAAIFADKSGDKLHVGDFIERVGSISFKDFHENKKLVFFEDMQTGQAINLSVRRGLDQFTIPWVYVGFNTPEFMNRIVNVWLLSYVFWGFSAAALLSIRPRDLRWGLLIAANYLTALFIFFGSMSGWHIWSSPILMRAVIWLMLPVYIHFHWIFPAPLRRIPVGGWLAFYLISLIMAVLEFFPFSPRLPYTIILVLILVSSIVLLGARSFRKSQQRREVTLLAILSSIALVPLIIILLVAKGGPLPQTGPLALLTLPILPGAYFYAAYRSRLGGMELRANRAISMYAYLSLLGVGLLLSFKYIVTWETLEKGTLIATFILATLIIVFISILYYPRFKEFIDRHVLGIQLPYQNLLETYSTRIVTSKAMTDLLDILKSDVFPSLLVRQYAFLNITGSSANVLLSENVDQPEELVKKAVGAFLAPTTNGSLSFSISPIPLGWIRVVLPLRIGDELLGFWLLGRRDPDDYYSQAEIPILQSLANQTAIALSNLLQTDRLKSIYQANVNRYEQERLRLALDLHDSVLNEMAVLLMTLDPVAQTPEFQKAYDSLSQRLREIVTELRPPMLNFGLKLGLEELADNLIERNRGNIQISVNIQCEDDVRYAQDVEQHIYRMIQEGCENAIRHGQAEHIEILGNLSPNHIHLSIKDNGKGFDTRISLDLDKLLVHKHFGLAGMVERALLIGADIKIESTPDNGTHVFIAWDNKRDKLLRFEIAKTN